MRSGRATPALAALLLLVAFGQACGSNRPAPAGSGDAGFRQLAGEVLEYTFKRAPSNATYLGIHRYDQLIADYSAAAIHADSAALKDFRTQLDGVDAQALSLDAQLDLEQTKHALDGMLLRNDVIRGWARDPDVYSSGITNDAFVMISRNFAPPEQRLSALIAREKLMPNALAEARRNLDDPPRVFTEIAIEQAEGNRDFFAEDVLAAFAAVQDPALLAEFETANRAVIAALEDYQKWLASVPVPQAPAAQGQQLFTQLACTLAMTGSSTSRPTACISTASRKVGPLRARPFR